MANPQVLYGSVMSKRRNTTTSEAMLDLWRPPQGAGDPVGCLATTFTFAPGLFDEQCLARFLEIESEPSREDLAFLLERESRLGGVYAGVLVDHTQAGVEHSLRWDVLPVRIHGGKQHAKISLLAWAYHIRIIIASANLTDSGYRTNHEVATVVELTPEESDMNTLLSAVGFLRSLLIFVPGASYHPPEVSRAKKFLDQVEGQVIHWKASRQKGPIRQHLVFTLPDAGTGNPARSSLDEAVQLCRQRGGSPNEAWIASPFFDNDQDTNRVTASLCKMMSRGNRRQLWFCVPSATADEVTIPRIAAPKSLLSTPKSYNGDAMFEVLPKIDGDKNLRPWHAKMLALISYDDYSALMIGSSNFTCAGMGVGPRRNTEANLMTIVDYKDYSRDIGQLEAIWPDMEPVTDPDNAEWLGSQNEQEEEELAAAPVLPYGFLSATYRAGDQRRIILRLDPEELPGQWTIHTCGQDKSELLSASTWQTLGRPLVAELEWTPLLPPEKLLVQWEQHEAFLPINVEDGRSLPPPEQLTDMSADDMLWILAAADPSAAFRAWAKQRQSNLFDSDLDSAIPLDLDPLRRYDLQATFLHRIRRRARILALLRRNLERPVNGRQALEWRLRGLIGIEPLANRLVREFEEAAGKSDEALLTLADFLIVLREVDYQPADSALPKPVFNELFRSFLNELMVSLKKQVDGHRQLVAPELIAFWDRVVEACL